MAKVISYKFQPSEGNVLYNAEIVCKTQADFDANYPIAEKEAIGEILVDGEFDPEPETTDDVLNAMLGVN